MNRYISFAAFFLLLFSSFTFEDADWEFKRAKDGINVYWRDSADSDFKELKIELYLESSLSSIIAVLNEPSKYGEWIYGTMEARPLKVVSDHEMYYYSRTDFPWPLSDRDLINFSHLEQDPNTGVVTSTSHATTDLNIPLVEDVVRVTEFHSTWVIRPIRKNYNKVTYTFRSDPAGNLPSWMVNMALDRGPISTMENLRERLTQPTYRNATVSSVKEVYP